MVDKVLTEPSQLHFKVVASSKAICEDQQACKAKNQNRYYKHAEWSPDGTCVITNSADNHIRTFVIPPNLLEDREKPLSLEPYCTIASVEPVNALACYPAFDLQNPPTALVLSTASEHPIRLNSMLTSQLVASYPLVSPTTEALIKPQSLLFKPEGTRFIAGSESLLSTFDISRPGGQPVSSLKTGPKSSRAPWSNPGTSLRGLISALDIDQQYNVLAAGTLTRQVGLYDTAGQGDCVGVFSVKDSEADLNISGCGITQVRWSKCGRYLYIVERRSNGVMIYDIRKTGQLLSWVTERRAMTNQRMKVELSINPETCDEDVWAGGTDGVMRLWRAPHLSEGPIKPASHLKVHEGHVNSISKHLSANVIVTAAGQRQFLEPSIIKDESVQLWQLV